MHRTNSISKKTDKPPVEAVQIDIHAADTLGAGSLDLRIAQGPADQGNFRRYDDGALTADDFEAKCHRIESPAVAVARSQPIRLPKSATPSSIRLLLRRIVGPRASAVRTSMRSSYVTNHGTPVQRIRLFWITSKDTSISLNTMPSRCKHCSSKESSRDNFRREPGIRRRVPLRNWKPS